MVTVRKKRIVERCPNYPNWSLAKYKTFVRSAMRQAWRKWPPRYEALKLARRKYVGANKKQKWEFQCAHCKEWFMGTQVSVDHIEPWGKVWDLPILDAWARLLVSVTGLQVLCKACHDIKSKLESTVPFV